jgi:acid phosphatase family membrane protein YuiD
MNTSLVELFRSVCFWAPLSAWLIAQGTKMACGFLRTRRLDFGYLVSTGGMPSAHSAMVSALATIVGLESGFGAPLFALALAFALVTMFDASTVRQASGLQAKLLNEIIDELFKEHHFSERKLAELLGHTPLEVFMGMTIGILTGMFFGSLG